MTHSYRLNADEAPYAVVDQHENLDVIIDGKQAKALRGDYRSFCTTGFRDPLCGQLPVLETTARGVFRRC